MTLPIKYVLFAILATVINIATGKELCGLEFLCSGGFCVHSWCENKVARRREPQWMDRKADPVVWEGEGVRFSPIWIYND